MKTPPPEIIAAWPTPNYVDPDYQGPTLLIIGVILLVLSSTVVALRLWVRLFMKRSAGWDDWIMASAIPFIICSTVTANIGTKYGWGYHIWDSKIEWLKPSLMTSYFSQLLLAIIMMLVKLSLLTSYLRFLTVPIFRYLNWGMIAAVLAWGISFLIAMLTACRPLSGYWDIVVAQTAKCNEEEARTLAFTITNLISDVLVLVLPIPTFWTLKLPIRERLALTGLMSLGLVACTASAVRLYYAHRIYHVSYDVSWEGYKLWLWILVEINLAVICASIPTLRPLVRKYLPQLGFKGSGYQNSPSTYVSQSITHTSGVPQQIYTQKTIEQTIDTESTEALRDDDYHMTFLKL